MRVGKGSVKVERVGVCANGLIEAKSRAIEDDLIDVLRDVSSMLYAMREKDV